jgi:homogentisate 1,2-dioxygenase
MKELRKRMKKMGIGINDAENGIWLPYKSKNRVAGSKATAHAGEGVHGEAYKQHVWDTLKDAKTPQDFQDGLAKLENELFNGKTFPKK